MHASYGGPIRALLAGLAVLGGAGCASAPPAPPPLPPAAPAAVAEAGASRCDWSQPASGEPGARVLALVVGVSDYASPDVPDLRGPRQDAAGLYAMLTARAGFGVPADNVCLLVDGDATRARFEEALEGALTGRAAEGDAVLIFFAGHGSWTYDLERDESDGRDETLLLHDARTGGAADLLDDELALLLSGVLEKTGDVTLILDACSSGTAARGSEVTARQVPPAVREGLLSPGGGRVERAAGWLPPELPGVAVLSAARDGTVALEPSGGGNGFFTAALLAAMAETRGAGVTWAEVFRRSAAAVRLRTVDQRPVAEGTLDRLVLRGAAREGPLGWEVVEVGPDGALRVTGPPIPGFEVGAAVRIVRAAAPEEVVATATVREADGLSAWVVAAEGAATAVGDLALPDPDGAAVLVVAVDAGLDDAALEELEAAVAGSAVRLTRGDGELHLRRAGAAALALADAGGQLIARVPETPGWAAEVGRALEARVAQRALLALQGPGRDGLVDDVSVAVRLVVEGEVADSPRCAGEPVVLPLCAKWHIEVVGMVSEPLQVGGAVLWGDGTTLGLPTDGLDQALPPYSRVRLGPRFLATPPLGQVERVLVVGSAAATGPRWSRLTTPTKGGRGGAEPAVAAFAETAGDGPAWARTVVSFSVSANPALAVSPACVEGGAVPSLRTLDLRPYLPDDPGAPLARLLTAAARRASSGETGGALSVFDEAGLEPPAEGVGGCDPARDRRPGDRWVFEGTDRDAIVVDAALPAVWTDDGDGPVFRRARPEELAAARCGRSPEVAADEPGAAWLGDRPEAPCAS